MAKSGNTSGFPWRLVVLGPLAVTLFALAMYFYNNMQPELGLTLLGFAFGVPMVWAVLAAREADSGESPIRIFVPRLTTMLVLGSGFLAYTMWNINPRISAMECVFIILYLLAAGWVLRIFNNKPKRPQLTAFRGGNQTPRQRRRSP